MDNKEKEDASAGQEGFCTIWILAPLGSYSVQQHRSDVVIWIWNSGQPFTGVNLDQFSYFSKFEFLHQ